MEGKTNVIVYTDWIHIFEKLTDQEAGILIKHFFRYVNDMNPVAPDRITELTFEPIKLQLKRDLVEWKKKCERNAESARIRWEQKNATPCERIENNANASSRIDVNAKHADKDTDKDKDKDKDRYIESEVETSHAQKKTIGFRELEFTKSVSKISECKYPIEMIEQFTKYWTESNPGGRKMRFEMQKTFDITRRLETWASKDYNKTPQQNGTKKNSGLSTEQGQREFLEAVASGISRANS